jgi:hypothetical protein
MNAITRLKTAEEQLDKAVEYYKIALKQADKEIRNIRLSKKEVAEICEYTPTHLARLDIPFGAHGMIRVNMLTEWIRKHKPYRLKRMQKNLQAYYQ